MTNPACRTTFRGRAALVPRCALAIAVTLASGSRPAAAQTPSQTVPPGTRIYVRLAGGGRPLEGSLLALSADTVALLVNDQTQTVPLHQVRRIDKDGDPASDGAAKGALIVGLWCVLVCGQGVDNGGQFGLAVLTNAALGGLIGWQFDRDHVGRSRIYPAKTDWRDRRGTP